MPTALTSQEVGLTQEQIALFEQRYANGYDLCHDSAYSAWLHKKNNCLKIILSSDLLSDQCHDEQQDDLLAQNAPTNTPTNSADDSVSPICFLQADCVKVTRHRNYHPTVVVRTVKVYVWPRSSNKFCNKFFQK